MSCTGHSRTALIAVSPHHMLVLASSPLCLPHLPPHPADLCSSWLSQLGSARGSVLKGLSLHVHGPLCLLFLGTHPHVWSRLFTCLSLVD